MEEKAQFGSPQEEIQYLEQKILEKKKALESTPHRDIISETLKEHTATAVPIAPAPTASAMQADEPLSNDVAYLVQTAFQKGIAEAVDQVRRTHNPYLIDSFHDALVDKFLDEMKQKGILVHG